MGKMLGTTFPRRRPAGYVRYGIIAIVILIVFYSLSGDDSSDSLPPASALTGPDSASHPADTDPHKASSSFSSNKDDSWASPPTLADDKPKLPTYGSPVDDTTDKTSSDHAHSIADSDVEHDPSDHLLPGSGSVGSTAGSHDSSTGSSSDATDPIDASKDSSTSSGDSSAGYNHDSHSSTSSSSGPEDGHPIDKLIYDAQHNFAEMLSKQSKTVEEAAQAYRKSRGRHPPPGFDKWFEFAQSLDAVIVEDFFDQVYHDLGPFWGVPAATLRKESWDFEMVISVRDGVATAGSDWFWTQIWLKLIKTIEHLLPDMDLALNAMDEPRLVVPYAEVERLVAEGGKTAHLAQASTVSDEFQHLPEPGQGDLNTPTRDKAFKEIRPYWEVAQRGCPPDSLAQTTEHQKSFAEPPQINTSFADPHSYKGYVSNFTLSSDICHQPDLQGLEGIFIEPLSVSASDVMFPMFGGSKLAVNNEILLPAPMYWNEEERFTGGSDHGIAWAEKQNKVIWRGVATGGKNRADNWRGFQRHRFVAMNNGTQVSLVESGEDKAQNFNLPDEQYAMSAQSKNKMGEWIKEWTDVSFIDLMCEPPMPDGSCPHTNDYFERAPGLSMVEQFNSKFLPDIDGNSFSGRYLGFLRSTSLPIKATVWREWHDSRLVPWKHFVPMDSRFGDYYGIMEYFLGYEGRGGHDKAAEKIASEGKEWAEQVLRQQDMQIYVLRLLLEYGRILDDDRANMGWVGDALKNPALEKTWADWKL